MGEGRLRPVSVLADRKYTRECTQILIAHKTLTISEEAYDPFSPDEEQATAIEKVLEKRLGSRW